MPRFSRHRLTGQTCTATGNAYALAGGLANSLNTTSVGAVYGLHNPGGVSEVFSGCPAVWEYIDLGANHTISLVTIAFEAAVTRGTAYEIDWLPAGADPKTATWNVAATITGNANQITADTITGVTAAQYIRVYIANPFTSAVTVGYGLKWSYIEVLGQ